MVPLPPVESLSHAYLVTGGSAQDRREYARRLAAAWLCTGARPPCGACHACVKVQKGIHPDVELLTCREGRREIPVADVRAMRRNVYIVPNEGKRRVFLIDPADAMAPAAQSALLKVLEDGPAYAAFALLCEQPGALLETVRSRCETLCLPPGGEPEAEAELAQAGRELARVLLYGTEWEAARLLTRLEQERPKGAQALDVFAQAELAVRAELGRCRRAAPVLEALRRCRQSAPFNPGAGHLYGWLCTATFS